MVPTQQKKQHHHIPSVPYYDVKGRSDSLFTLSATTPVTLGTSSRVKGRLQLTEAAHFLKNFLSIMFGKVPDEPVEISTNISAATARTEHRSCMATKKTEIFVVWLQALVVFFKACNGFMSLAKEF